MTMNSFAYIPGFPVDKPVIHFYALIMLFGAVVALFLSNYRAHKAGFGWDFFDSVFLLAFPSGVVGARIWYVVATWSQEFSNRPFYEVFAIWNGGLAIQGGALGGIIAGVLFCLFRRRGTSILCCMDFAIPTILIAQAIGRWGNFFNQEVFGHAVSLEAWNFLPSWITQNMQNGSEGMLGAYNVILAPGTIVAPLFLVEGVVNVMFYFLIAHGLPALEGKFYRDGDTSFSYFVAYGIVRLLLEPLRNSTFIMGEGASEALNKSDYKSYSMAIAYIVIGLTLILLNHIFFFLARRGKLDSLPALKKVFIDEAAVELHVPVIDRKDDRVFASQVEAPSSIDLSKLKAKEEERKGKESDPNGK